jgi:hypothetical protein
MSATFRDFWWLIFPVMSFAFAGLNRWMRYKRQHDAIELLRTYAANGREPPPEVLNLVVGTSSCGSEGGGGGRHLQGLWGATFILGSLAAGFFIANKSVASDGGFAIVGVILGSLSIGMLLYAVSATYLDRRR